MPSPFPGMDPFLEHPDIFPDLHDSLNAYLREFLQARLPERYYAKIGTRIWVEVADRFIGPDVHVLEATRQAPSGQSAGGGVAVAPALRTQPITIQVAHDERREAFLEIRTRQGERLVTVIEILSLTNKTPGEHGRDLYLRKQQNVLGNDVHLVEIDLLRGGEDTVAAPRALVVAKAGPFDYQVCVHRFDELERFYVYPIRLAERLPEIAVPLLPGDASVAVDLQAVFERCYEAGPYRRMVRYQETTPVPPLRPEQAEWARTIVDARGKLPAGN